MNHNAHVVAYMQALASAMPAKVVGSFNRWTTVRQY